MKHTAFRAAVKVAWLIGHPTTFILLMAFVLACVTAGRMTSLAALASTAVLAATFGFRSSIVVLSRVFAKPPAAVLESLLAWNRSDRLSARIALLKHPG
ncbi:hypothetical protein A9R05_43195 (plasmid) [Burkholderia sp. KK1]|uniref:Uncharacterized protein n=1 Tax=Burkholderia sp. M701 TaxID=326454 RepID=V5YQ42_9BURK|nr:hypothetical protein [Burkholderia sp. M701]AQH05821.1 hypothetical protein A9R05_43195 [Burkholderia sp. KK1]BAO19041.1 hypothetical protein [Burkholderia sp. M701]